MMPSISSEVGHLLNARSKITYRPTWELLVRQDEGGRWYLQWEFDATDVVTGNPHAVHRSRKWWLSQHMTVSEFVQTAFLAALQAEEHECRERFTYGEYRPFHPHISLEALCAASVSTEVRQ